MSTVPGGEVREPRCAEFDAAAVRRAAEIRATGRPRSNRSTTSRATSRSTPSRTRRRRGWSSSRPPTLKASLLREMERQGRSVVPCSSEDGAARVRRSTRRRVPRGDGTGSGGRGCLRTTTRRDRRCRDAPAFAGRVHRCDGVAASRGPLRRVTRIAGLRRRGPRPDPSPLGLDLGGRRPEEIALSIAAGLVAARHGREGGWLDR